MLTPAAAAGSNDTVVNATAQELVCNGKIEIRLTSRLKIFIRRYKMVLWQP